MILAQELAGADGGDGGAGVEDGEEGVGGDEACAFGDPAEGEAHEKLDDSGEDGHGGLRAAHEMAGDDGHQRGLRDYTAESAAEAEQNLHHGGADEKGDKRCGHVSDSEHGAGSDVAGHAKFFAELAGDESAGDGADGPACF